MNLLFLFCGKKLGASLGRGLLFKAGIPNLEGLILESTKFGQWLLKVYCGIFKLKLLFPPSRLFTSTFECVWVVTVGRKYDVSKELNLETIRAVLFHSLPVILFLLTIDATCQPPFIDGCTEQAIRNAPRQKKGPDSVKINPPARCWVGFCL